MDSAGSGAAGRRPRAGVGKRSWPSFLTTGTAVPILEAMKNEANTRYEVTESRRLRNKVSGEVFGLFTALPYGAVADWEAVTVGWTVLDTHTGTVGVGRAPFASRAEAAALVAVLNARGSK
jgi:hypothetical protein